MGIIILYQKAISPLFPPTCRYVPTCSEYTKKAIIKYGPFKGVKLGLTRILKCHPWGGSGDAPLD